jgi:hypothetical protein
MSSLTRSEGVDDRHGWSCSTDEQKCYLHHYTVRGPVISSVRRVKLLPKDLAYRVIWGIIWRMVDWMTAVR